MIPVEYAAESHENVSKHNNYSSILMHNFAESHETLTKTALTQLLIDCMV